MEIEIEAILLETTRLDMLKEFYQKGFELDEPETSSSEQIGFQIGAVYFGLEQVEAQPDPSRTMSLWFRVKDAQSMYDKLISLGATMKDEPAEIDDEIVASVYDPDGNAIGLLSES